jgi:hypothetical protein
MTAARFPTEDVERLFAPLQARMHVKRGRRSVGQSPCSRRRFGRAVGFEYDARYARCGRAAQVRGSPRARRRSRIRGSGARPSRALPRDTCTRSHFARWSGDSSLATRSSTVRKGRGSYVCLGYPPGTTYRRRTPRRAVATLEKVSRMKGLRARSAAVSRNGKTLVLTVRLVGGTSVAFPVSRVRGIEYQE